MDKNGIVTTRQLSAKYHISGENMRVLRVKLQFAGVIGKTKKGGPYPAQTYPLLKELPDTRAQVHDLYANFHRCTIRDVLSDAHGDLEELADEMTTWAEGMAGTNLESTFMYEQVEDASSQLTEGAYSLDACIEALPAYVAEMEIVSVPLYDTQLMTGRSRILSRARRLTNIAGALSDVQGELQVLMDNRKDETADESKGEEDETADESKDEEEVMMGANESVDECLSTLEETIDAIDGIDFPGFQGCTDSWLGIWPTSSSCFAY